MPTLIILFVNSGETLDGEIKVISLYFLDVKGREVYAIGRIHPLRTLSGGSIHGVRVIEGAARMLQKLWRCEL